ncbi:hypothetical protein A9Y57_00156 [Streptococcus parauberis]|uniref:DUF3168 domain-containing protein n=1 Tax=Streptococcus parauberis TaxID=1348 RepID=A0A854WSQ8_9STRE|nr:hypothetical protein [Streptococcus parauberis]PCH13887.1 hypothetical protein A9Y57_00522 [Streptococcus parauberis]PCH14153.1 hypothetical protein A9Y57_00156 [Streptococcus parauberis]
MKEVIKNILEKLQTVVPESYYMSNDNPSLTYPYLVFKTSVERLTWETDGAYLDIDIYNNKGFDQEEIENTVDAVKQLLNHYTVMLDACFLRVRFESSDDTLPNSDTLQRRYMRFYLKIDWRN